MKSKLRCEWENQFRKEPELVATTKAGKTGASTAGGAGR